ncbi:MAG: thiamine-phosphate synthase family protein, partial [Promethearchaeota archaeon]
MQISDEKKNIINQIREIYNIISKDKDFSKLIPEVRMNISGSLSNAKNQSEIAGIEGRITIINGFPKASGEIKFGISNHTARLILTAKEFDKSINFVINLKYIAKLIESIKKDTTLELQEIIREEQPESVKEKEYSTMQWLIKESVKKKGKI